MPDLVPPLGLDGRLPAEQPRIDGDGLALRPWRADDADALVRAYSDPGIQRWHLRTLDADEARGWAALRAEQWRERSAADWAVVEVGDDRDGPVLGRMGLRRVDWGQALAEVVYWVLPEARGRAVARRALALLTGWAFGEVGLHRLELCHATANQASCHVATGAGFVLEGTDRSAARHADGWHDVHRHARLATD